MVEKRLNGVLSKFSCGSRLYRVMGTEALLSDFGASERYFC